MRKSLLILFISMLTAVALAEETDTTAAGVRLRASVNMRISHVFPATDFFRGENFHYKEIPTTYAPHFQLSFRFSENSKMGRLFPHAYQGIGVGLHRFPYGRQTRTGMGYDPSIDPYRNQGHELGSPVSVYLFQGSRIARLSQRLSLDYEWNFGASFGWQPYDEKWNYNNTVVGSRVNAYMNLGFMLNYRIAREWNLTAGIDLAHFSNGNTRYPNKGVNTMGLRIGIAHDFKPVDEDKKGENPVINKHLSWDIMAYAAARCYAFMIDDQPCILPGNYLVMGLSGGPMWNFSKYFRAGASIDAQFDDGANISRHFAYYDTDDRPRFYRPPLCERLTVGMALHAEFRMNIFAINVSLGHSLLGRYEQEGFYQTLALKTFLTPHFYLNTGYRLHSFREPNNLMMGVGVRL